FLLFGGTAALASLVVGVLLYGSGLFPGLPYWCATVTAAGCGTIVNFTLNYSLNFRFRGRSALSQFWTFCVVSGGGIILTGLISTGFLNVFESNFGTAFHLFHMNIPTDFAAQAIAIALVTFYSFPAHKFFSFSVGIRARLQHLRPLAEWVR
ncbi:MAG TPA: GtrA family protein, partial [Bradyrhizobium sp.]